MSMSTTRGREGGPLDGLVVVLVRPEGPHNVGGVARLCGNFGASLRLVAPQCDHTQTEAMKMAHPRQAELQAAPVWPELGPALGDVAFSLATSGKLADAVQAPALDVGRARLLLPSPPERLALVFGNERTGLAKDEAALCTRTVSLPTPGPVDSLNLASAVAVTLTLFAEAARGEAGSRASVGARAALLEAWHEALGSAGVYQRQGRESFTPRLVELLDKMDLTDRDAALMVDLLASLRR
jgi:tRNA/rRNA methyltransferase